MSLVIVKKKVRSQTNRQALLQIYARTSSNDETGTHVSAHIFIAAMDLTKSERLEFNFMTIVRLLIVMDSAR